MYSREESKKIKQDFWTLFGKRYDRKWLRYHTGIKDLNLKMDFEDRRAIVAIDIEHDDELYRAYYFEKFESLRGIMLEEVSPDLIFDPNYTLSSGKDISRVYLYKEGVKIQRKTDWPEVYEFFYREMDKLERFFLEYRDYIEQ
ncbi:MAG: DUF4268 domain-containing protein [Nonlabens sp.]